MLFGKIKYKDKHVGVVEYEVYARDSFVDTKLLMRCSSDNYTNYVNALLCFDKQDTVDGGYENLLEGGVEVSNKWGRKETLPVEDVRRLDVKKNNKYKSNITNKDLALKISALVRFMQTRKIVESTEENKKFSIFKDVVVDGVGKVTYKMGIIDHIECANSFVSINLRSTKDNPFEESVFKDLKAKDKYNNVLSVAPIDIVGFKLSKEVLGFEYKALDDVENVNIMRVYSNLEEVMENNQDKNLDWLKNRNYSIVTDSNLESIMEEFMGYDGLIAFDTETTGLNINFKSRSNAAAQLVGVVLSKEKGTGYYFPLQHKLFPNLCDGEHWYFMEKYMRKLLETKKIICHNIKFDWKVAYIYGINVNCIYDTMLAFGVTKRYEEETFELNLKSLARTIFGIDMLELSDFVSGTSFSSSGVTFADLPYELVKNYAPADADMTLSLCEFIEANDLINKYNAKTIFELEIEFAKAVAYSEFYGYCADVDRIPELASRIEHEMVDLCKKMYDMAGGEFNPRSPKQLLKIMYEDLGIEKLSEKPSTDAETLKALSTYTKEDGSLKYPFVELLKSYRGTEGLYKNFLKKLPEFCSADGYIFPEVLQLGADTGRCSVKNPNYQSYNNTVKQYIIPRNDFMHFDCDFSQIEYRVLASEAKQHDLIRQFGDPDMDYHTYQASRMFSVHYGAVSKSLRNQSKGINFGLPFGMGDSSLGARIFGERNEDNTRKAADLRKKFFQGQERIQEYFESARSTGVKKGWTETAFGRRRYYHRGVYSVSEIRRQAGNHVVQGTAADIYKFAVVRLFRRVCKEGWLGLVLFNAFVHDELLLEVHKSINPYYFIKAWKEEFQVSIDGYCPLFAGMGVGLCWYDAKKLELPVQYTDSLISQWHEDMSWNEDIKGFIEGVKVGLLEYKVERVESYIKDTSSQGEIIKPVISSLLQELVDLKVSELGSKISSVNLCFGSNIVSDNGKHKAKSVKDLVKLYCCMRGIDSSTINILGPDDIVVNTAVSFEVEEKRFDGGIEELAFAFTQYSGAYLDADNEVAYFVNKVNKNGVNILEFCNSKGLFSEEGSYGVRLFLDDSKPEVTETVARVTSDNFKIIKENYKAFLRGVY